MLVANYVGGNVTVLPVQRNGGLGAPVDLKQHEGTGPDPKRQDAPHAHNVVLDAANRYAFVSDLGTDKIHPNGRFAFLITELDSTVTAFAYDKAQGTLKALQTVPALPEGFTGASYCADLHVSPDGRFLHGSNRGHDSIAMKLSDTFPGHQPGAQPAVATPVAGRPIHHHDALRASPRRT